MSRLSEILNVEEGQEFEYEGNKLKVVNDKIFDADTIDGEEYWFVLSNAEFLMSIIAFPEKIKIIPTKPKLTEKQITAIKGRIAEGWKYITKDRDSEIIFYEVEPEYDEWYGYFDSTGDYSMVTLQIYDFLQPGDCFYLTDLIGDEEE